MKNQRRPYHSIRKPNYIGGDEAFVKFLDENIIYPEEALKNKIQGLSFIKIEISDRGKVISAKTMNKLGYGLDEEAVRLSMLLKFENTVERGLKVKHTKNIRILFKLPEAPTVSMNINYETTTTTATGDENNTSGGYNYTIKFA